MIITTQVTKDYYPKALELWKSIKQHWPYRFVLGCIDFEPEGFDGEYFVVKKEDIGSYRTNWPTNRSSFVTMQNGEFIDYIKCDEDDIIIQIDADCIMQRGLTEKEKNHIEFKLMIYDVLVVESSRPATNLTDALVNLGGPKQDRWSLENEFTNSMLIGKPMFFRNLKGLYLQEFDAMTKLTGHHAGVQWLCNICCIGANVFILQPSIQCATWYNTFNTTIEEGVLKVDGETVLFNHTK